MSRRGRVVASLVLFLGAAGLPASAQMDPYEARYGPVADVSIDDLLQMPEFYRDKPVRTRGELELLPSTGGARYALRGTFGGHLMVAPMAEAANEWEWQAHLWVGREVEVTGRVGTGTDSSTGTPVTMLAMWGFRGPKEETGTSREVATPTTLESLVTRPGKLEGKLVVVTGQFRGQNLFGDLPSASRRRSADWVIKDDLYAVWVTGKRPRGSGWAFDPELKRDTGKWLQVTGRVAISRGVVTIDADQVALSKPPTPTSEAAPPPALPPRPKKPPVVAFSLPLDGERDVPPNSVFKVQFSKDMDEASFKGRITLRYAGRPQPGDRDLDAVKVEYDGGLRTVRIDPGDLLRAGRVVEILLLPGIVDIDGLSLQTRPGKNPGPATDALRFQIGADGLTSQ